MYPRMSSLLVALPFLSRVSPTPSPADTLTNHDLRNIPSPGDDFDVETGSLLAPILVPRGPGTEGSHKVQRHLVDFFTANLPSWVISSENSTSRTPATGEREVPFSNWIFRRDPPWADVGSVTRLTFAAHFDSLMEPQGFVGAVDSAASCAMLLHLARSIDAALGAKWAAMEENGVDTLRDTQGVQIIFFDGEEAFAEWSDADSLYGSRSLAKEWESTKYGVLSLYRSPLQAIDIFVLLDLLGAPSPSVPSYYLPTHWAYQKMAALERRMRALSLLESSPRRPFLPDSKRDATSFARGFLIEDDHMPFMRRGVDVLHVMPNMYPRVWHTMEDNGEHLDLDTCRDWSRIVTAFAMEWLGLGEYLPGRV
ncbi:Glutaminyl-peptide cyclotransferase-like protein [Emericellopsis cladophorae]|uniref:Peptide hydrolase n=1 Tax=Emericellopsis cladophorae TaxID=2686198 RepID=A0A9P9XUZ6_9HYPO|nr:Glutaminyl-peptide cyclotransferase-like protein [Emericellopsis cladophorae]KAI6778301.1 Glutaminyl-peptide cyclotransferase-like protein [Emericellopsis cladophorae]